MRRIEALTGEEALTHVESAEGLLEDLQRVLGASRADIPVQVEKLRQALKDREREIKTLRQKADRTSVEEGEEDVKKVKGIPVLVKRIEGLGADEIRDLADSLKQKLGSGIVILGQADGPKAVLVVSVTKDLAGRAPANKLIKSLAAFIGGSGGGRPDFAQAGGPKPENLDEALGRSVSLLEDLL